MKELIKCGSAIFRKDMFNHAVILPLDNSEAHFICASINGMGDSVILHASKDYQEITDTLDNLSKDLGL